MASVYLQAGRSRNWVARFKGPDGRWTARSTGLTNRAGALKLAFLWEGNLTDEALADPTAARIDSVVRSPASIPPSGNAAEFRERVALFRPRDVR